MPKPYLLAETTWKTTRTTNYQLAVLPWGATEAHNYHLPYATDNYQVEYIAAEAGRKAWEAGAKLLILPNMPFGVNTGQLDVKLCMNVNPSTQLAILQDTVDVLHRHGIRKLVILNGHGGNNFKSMIRELSVSYPKVFVCWADWFKALPLNDYFDEPGDHAGEMETSVMMHIVPELVLPLSEAGDGAAKKYKVPALNEGWTATQREWTQVTKDTGVGNPARATPEKGKRYLEDLTNKLSRFFIDLAAADPDGLYE